MKGEVQRVGIFPFINRISGLWKVKGVSHEQY